MSDFSKYLKDVSVDLKTLQGDITKMISAKNKELKDSSKDSKDSKDSNKKVSAKEQFSKLSLKSMQPVTKMYDNKEEIKKAVDNPEIDFITKRIETIFDK